ncbi:cytochrome P450 [Aspergillus venezuelensis]
MFSILSLAVAAVGLLGLYALRRILERASSPVSYLPLPPGPKPLPVVGNLHDLPAKDEPDWLHWVKHKDFYGPISTVSVLGQRLILLNDAQLAIDLLHKKAGVHSDRPDAPMAVLSGWGNGSAIIRYSPLVTAGRKNMHREIGTQAAVSRFQGTQDIEVRRFLLRVLNGPSQLAQHARKLAGAVILKITYGYEIDQGDGADDPLVDIADTALVNFSISARPGTWAVDLFPALKYIPSWVPGASFQRTAALFRKQTEALADVPWAFVKRQMNSSSTYNPSYVSNLLDANPGIRVGSPEETSIRWTAASLYGGGADTTVSTIATFYLAMTLFPDVQKTAQAEIDTVIGRSRLPSSDDREKLPYINALVKEALRWHPVIPMGLPHRAMVDDSCNGYLIPKDSVILANLWAFTHDENTYKSPSEFNPSRFLGDSPEKDPHTLVFGFGRRICPGRVLADRTIFLAIAQSLAAFEIQPPKSGGRDEYKTKDQQQFSRTQFSPGVISHSKPFDVDITLRDQAYEDLVRGVEGVDWKTEHADILRDLAAEMNQG